MLRNCGRQRQLFRSDDRGAEVTELGIVLGTIVAGCIVAVLSVGPKIVTMYQNVNSAIP